MTRRAILLSGAEIAALAGPADYLAAVREGFLAEAQGRVDAPAPLHLEAAEGGFHAKGAHYRAPDGRAYAAVKVNANFPGNPARFGLPTVAGALLLFDAGDGALLMIGDSAAITARRTAAASALAADLFADPASRRLLIIGAGPLGAAHVEAIIGIRPIDHVAIGDRAAAAAERLAATLRARGLAAEATTDVKSAARAADIIVTATTATAPVLDVDDVRDGAFIAAAGADGPAKNEIAPALTARARLVADKTAQCLAMGELRAAVAAGVVRADDVACELSAALVGSPPFERRCSDIVIFDSTGVAHQDAASAAMIHARAVAAGKGVAIALE